MRVHDRHPLAGKACVQMTEVQASTETSKSQSKNLEEQSFMTGKVFIKRHFTFIKDFDKTNDNISSKLLNFATSSP